MLSTLLSLFKEVLPIYLLYIAVQVAFRFIKRLFTPKYDGIIFDDDFASDFDLYIFSKVFAKGSVIIV